MCILVGTSLCPYCKNANEQHKGAKTPEGPVTGDPGSELQTTSDGNAAYVWTLPVWCAYMLLAGGWGGTLPQ